MGQLSEESYNFLHGFPTEHCGSWRTDGTVGCGNHKCSQLTHIWRRMSACGKEWDDLQREECHLCAQEREQRSRLLAEADKRVKQEPFVDAPFIHKNNEPKYHALLLRAEEHAKAAGKFCLWFAAEDTPVNPAEVGKNP